MLQVPATAKPSKIHGVGTFADEFIPKGTVVWKYNPAFDLAFTEDDLVTVPSVQAHHVRWYAYFSKFSNRYIYSVDDSRFFNHAVDSNTTSTFLPGETEPSDVANRDIKAGEEITVNYEAFHKFTPEEKAEYV